ncbi:MAG TPA: ABC transporter permease [Gemmatimonadales bacterium]|nr:ABC transporter permease [Gemmatimonadales bacterium]
MARWLARRTAQALLTLLVAIVLLFLLTHLLPGDPMAREGMAHSLSAAQREALDARYGLDRPMLAQLVAFLAGLLRGDLGTSFEYGRPVTTLLAERLPATLLLGGSVLLLNFTVGLWLGVRQAVRKDSAEDRWLTALSLAGYSTPSFWLGLVLAATIGVRWHLLPPAGMRDPLVSGGLLAQTADLLRHLVLPVLTLSLVSIAGAMRYQRTAMLETLHLPFILTARAKGLSERQVTWRHAWRNALFPVLTLFGLWLPILVTGSVFVESVFAWPGLGSLAAAAVGSRDYPLLIGASVLVAAIVIAASLLSDIAYACLDPRVRLS